MDADAEALAELFREDDFGCPVEIVVVSADGAQTFPARHYPTSKVVQVPDLTDRRRLREALAVKGALASVEADGKVWRWVT